MKSMTYSTSDIFSTINNKSVSFNGCNFTFAFFNAAYHANPGALGKRAGSSSHISRHIF